MNPLLENSKLSYEAIDFNKIKPEHFLPALEKAIEEAKSNLDKIKNEDEITFEKIIEAEETSSDRLDLICEVFYSLYSAHCTDEISKIAPEFNEKLTAYTSDVSLDEKLFSKVKEVYDKRDQLELTQEQKTVLENSYKGFTRNGALLDNTKKEQLREIDQKLSKLSLNFSENIRKAMGAFYLEITDEKDLEGMPEAVIEAAKEAAKEKELENSWVFTLDYPSMLPFMQYCPNRELRKKMWEASSTKACFGEFDNRENIIETLKMRKKRANLLGYGNHPEFVLEQRMAKKPGVVLDFVEQLKNKSLLKAKEEFQKLKAFKVSVSGDESFEAYDSAMYTELYKKDQLDFDDEILRPYFKLENVIDGVFTTASKLYDIEFNKIELPVYHKDVDVYEVKDTSGNFVGLFYTDFFPRKEKRPGAWMTTFRNGGLQFGEEKRPFVSIVCNFTKPTASKPSLLTLNEVYTLFHEFGHALHGLLGKSRYKSVNGTNVLWDFVELPSQIMENWVNEKECLSLFAKHFETGELIPDSLIEKINESIKFLEGMATLRQVSFATLDMSMHMMEPEQIEDIIEEENSIMKDFKLFSTKSEGAMAPAFGHIFAGGYSAGYYSYKWAEVLDADAFAAFQENGIFDKETAKKFKENILEMGGAIDPMELYKRFRGKEPTPDALFKRAGLI